MEWSRTGSNGLQCNRKANHKVFSSKRRPELSFSVTHDAWNAKLGLNVASSTDEHVALLIETLNGLEALASKQPEERSAGLIIDEFQRIARSVVDRLNHK